MTEIVVREVLADLIDAGLSRAPRTTWAKALLAAADAVIAAGWTPPAALGALTSPPSPDADRLAQQMFEWHNPHLEGRRFYPTTGEDDGFWLNMAQSALDSLGSPVPQERTEGEPALVEWSAMIWEAKSRCWDPVGSEGDREHAESEMRAWQAVLPGGHYRIASRTISAWSAVASPVEGEGA